MSLITIAPLGKVLFSSRSKWSTENDVQEIVTNITEVKYPFMSIKMVRNKYKD